MNKNDIKSIIDSFNKDACFTIYTDIPRGKGINGIEYKSYTSNWSYNPKGSEGYDITCEIISYEENYIKIKKRIKERTYSEIKEIDTIVFIPYDRITYIKLRLNHDAKR